MFASVFEESIVLRLSAADRAELAREPGARPFEPMPGRPMRDHLLAPAAVVEAPARLRPWLPRAQAYVRTLPPKRKPVNH